MRASFYIMHIIINFYHDNNEISLGGNHEEI